MAENSRKCLKCGCSPGVDPNTKLFRFPKPGITNTLKCELWAKYCFPNGEWSSQEFQQKLHREHRMLCHRHFKRTSFSDYPQNTTKLHKFAVPDEELLPISSKDCERESFPSSSGILIDITINKQQEKLLPISSEDCERDFLPSSSGILIDITNKQQEKLLPISSKDCERESIPSSSGLIDITNKQQEKLLPISSKDCERESFPSSSGILIDITNKQQEKVAPVHNQPVDLKLGNKKKTDIDKNVLYRKCRANLKKIYQLKKRIKSLKNTNMLQTIIKDKAVGKLMKHVTPAFALMLQAQLRNTKRKYKGRRWSLDDKIICLRMYKRSATCYRLLRRIWCLPAPSTLKNLLRKFNLQAGLNERIFNSLKKYMKTQEPLDQEYILMFDEMSIRKHLWYNPKEDRVDGYQDHGNHGRSPQEATHALVFMVSGIRKKTKQPVAFYLSSAYVTADRLAILIKEVLQKCFSINMNISATVCDMGGVNRRALNILGASTETPYFQCENNEVVTIFDPPHLLKCFRNLFLKYNIKCDASIISDNIKGQGIAKWKHIEDFYEVDNSHPNFVYAPKLRKEHINPNSKQKMRVYLAAQVLSYSVAGGIFARISDGLLTSEAAITGDMIKKMDMLFDCLNSNSADHKKGKPHLTNFTDESPHLALFEEMKKFFQNAEFIGCKSLPPSKQGWIWALNAVARVYHNLKRKYKIKALATRHLQQDPLENLFGTIRANCGANCNPTTGQFIGGLKTAMLSNLAHMGSGSGNCKLDECESVLTNYKRMLYSTEQPKSPLNMSEMLSSIESTFDESVSEQSDTVELQACAYVCGFMLKNLKNNACTACNEILKTKNQDDLLYTFMHFKEYDDTKKSLKYASEEFIQCVESCATQCNNLFSVSSYSLNLKEKTLKTLSKNINFSFLRTCEVHFFYNISFITNSVFHICIKRFCTVKNRNFVEAASAGLKRKIDTLKHI